MKMTMTRSRIILSSLALIVLIGTMLLLNGVSRPPEDMETIELHATWPRRSLASASSEAEMIVYGKVIGRGSPQIYEYYGHYSPTEKFQIVYTPVTIEVAEWLKGSEQTKTIVYNELGGAMNGYNYIYSDFERLEMSDEIIIFLNNQGGFLGPESLMYVRDSIVSVPLSMRPEKNTTINGFSGGTNTGTTFDIREYGTLIKALAK